jgi:hypothetical protein
MVARIFDVDSSWEVTLLPARSFVTCLVLKTFSVCVGRDFVAVMRKADGDSVSRVADEFVEYRRAAFSCVSWLAAYASKGLLFSVRSIKRESGEGGNL